MNERVVREGTVLTVDGDIARVVVGRPDACGHCAASNACHTFSGGRTHEARARNLCGAVPGQRVRLEMDAASLLGAAFLVYFLPSLGILLCSWAGHVFGPHLGLSRNAGGVTGAALALAATALFLFIHSRLHRNHPPAFDATEVLPDAPQEAPCPGSTRD
jgi:positive regulator of sigma E activity